MNELEDNLNDYINGSISFLTYRQKRTAYINNFVNSGYLPDDTIPLNAVDQQQVKDAVEEKNKSSQPLESASLSINNRNHQSSKKQYIILALLIITAGLAWFYSTQMSVPSSQASLTQPSTKQIDNTSNIASGPTKSTTNKTLDKKFIVNFLSRDQWNSDTLSSFLVKWQTLSRIEKKQTKQSKSFLRLKNSLRLRILEQQALQSSKNKAAIRQENLLIWFGSQLSINVS